MLHNANEKLSVSIAHHLNSITMYHRVVLKILKRFLCMCILQLPEMLAKESAINHSEYLLYDLLEDYDMYVRPVQQANETVHVYTGLFLISIQEYDEMEGTFSFIAVLGLEWKDTRMSWDPDWYGGVRYTHVGYDKVWVPDLYCVNSATNFMPVFNLKQRVGYYASGHGSFAPGALFTVSCAGNMEKYPFDSQTCHLSFNAWNYKKGEVTLIPISDVINLDELTNNNMWTVVNTRVGNILNEGGVQLDVFIEIKRKSRFVSVNVVVPLVFLSCLNNLVFLLIPEAGERISLCITVLLSISVYLTILNQSLPQSSEPVPIISYKIIADLAVSYLIMLTVMINLRLYNKPDEERVPHFVKTLYKFLTCTCRIRKGIERNKDSNSNLSNGNLEKSDDRMDKTQIQNPFEDDELYENITWIDISASVDFVCFIVFNILTLCNLYVFIERTYL